MSVGGVCSEHPDKQGLLQVGWHGGWYNPMLGGEHGSVHATELLYLEVML